MPTCLNLIRMKNLKIIYLFIFILFAFIACQEGDNPGPGVVNPTDTGWSLPLDEVVDGGVGKDGIVALSDPVFVEMNQINYLEDDDLIVGVKIGNTVKGYPHRILDWHEIVNDKIENTPIALTYCPLTGTALAWNREINGEATTFGVSGLLYNSNLIPYDRATNSNWSQLLSTSVNGDLRDSTIETYPVLETTWKDWKSIYPDAKVMSDQTGFYNNNYTAYPYGVYRTSNTYLIFPVNPLDDRLPAKERVLVLVSDNDALTFRFENFVNGPKVFNTKIVGLPLVAAGNQQENYMVGFESKLEDGTVLNFTSIDRVGDIIMKDNEGNEWNLFGEAVSGSRMGQKLQPVYATMGYWFSIGAFFKQAEIFGQKVDGPD